MNGQANHSETASLATCGKQKTNHLNNLSKSETRKEELDENDKDKSTSSKTGIVIMIKFFTLPIFLKQVIPSCHFDHLTGVV